MADVKFDYTGMAEKYKDFTTIVGSSSDSTSIAGILNDTNQDVTDYVEVLDQAIYGDLGKQLKMDWDNFSSDFPKFVEMFDSWATYVASAAGDYSKAEADIAAFNAAHPLGFGSPEGMTQGYVQTGFYSQAYTSEQIQAMRDVAQFYELTGANYIDTGMVAFSKRNAWFNGIGDVLNIATCVIGGTSIFNAVKAFNAVKFVHPNSLVPIGQAGAGYPGYIVGAVNPLNPAQHAATWVQGGFWNTISSNPTLWRVATAGVNAQTAYAAMGVSQLGAATLTTGTSLAGKVFSRLGANYNPEVYMTGQDYMTAWGGVSDTTVNGTTYHYATSTTSGKQLYYDDQGSLFYINGGKATPVTNNNGGGNATLNDMGEQFNINVGGENITQDSTFVNENVNNNNYRQYSQSLTGQVEVTGTVGERNYGQTPGPNASGATPVYPEESNDDNEILLEGTEGEPVGDSDNDAAPVSGGGVVTQENK